MKKPSLLPALLLISSIAAAPLPYFQELQAGTWPGTASPPNGGTTEVVFEVSNDDGLAITFKIPEMGMEITADEPLLEDDMLSFGLSLPGDTLSCALVRQEDGSFAGECVDQDGGAGWVTMSPPEAATH